MTGDPLASVAVPTTHGIAASSNRGHQKLSSPGVDSVSAHDALNEQNQAMDLDLDVYVEDDQQLQTKHSSEPAVISGGAEENARLRAEIERLQSDAVAEQSALDDMLAELTSAHEELQDAKARLADTESECAGLRAMLAQTVGSGNGAALGSPVTEVGPGSPAMQQMQQTINDLTVSLGIKDELLKTKESKLADERTSRLQLSQTLQSTLEQMAAHTQARDAVAPGQDAAAASEDRRKVGELQQHVRFFKDNSERVAQINRELKDQNRRLSENLEVKQRELDDERSTSTDLVLKMRAALAEEPR